MCMTYDIILLQETWLSKNENAPLKDVDDNFDAFGISAMNDENGYQIGRPYRGLAVLWRKEFTHACTVLSLDDVRLLCKYVCLCCYYCVFFSFLFNFNVVRSPTN